jgi:hypothetical protein
LYNCQHARKDNDEKNVLQFVHLIGFYLYSIIFTFFKTWLDLTILICCDLFKWHFRDQRCLLSSRAQQTLWCKLQGTAEFHIPLPKRKYQQVCYWQPMDRHHRPKIKRTCSKMHNYYCALTRHREFSVRWEWGI